MRHFPCQIIVSNILWLMAEYMVEKFNLAFNMNITYRFLKNKLDEFKKSYKMWKFLMKSTGISVDPETSMIYTSPEWWDNHEAVTNKY